MKKLSIAAVPFLFLALAVTPAQAVSATSALVSVASPQDVHPQNTERTGSRRRCIQTDRARCGRE